MDVQEISLPEQRLVEDTVFPLALSPKAEATREEALCWIQDNGPRLKALLLQHGALLLRGFPLDGPEAFEEALEAAQFENMPYVGGAAPRAQVTKGRILTANESPASELIPFHHEMAQVRFPPAYVFFYCQVPPQKGGATAIVHSNVVYRRFAESNPGFATKVEEEGLRYIRVMPTEDDATSPIGRSWKNTFQVETKEDAEERMRAMGTEWEWLANGELRTITAVVPAIRKDPRNGMKTFFNSMVAAFTGWQDSRNTASKAVVCGGGSPVNEQAVLSTQVAMDEESVAIPWQKGDMLWVDNGLVLHARQPFSGPRRILASIAIG